MAIITRGRGAGVSGDGAFTEAEKLALELELAFTSSDPTVQKQYGYDSTTGNLNQIIIYGYDSTTATTTIILFTKLLEYDSEDNLTKSTTTRILDSATLVKDFIYDIDGNITILTSVQTP